MIGFYIIKQFIFNLYNCKFNLKKKNSPFDLWQTAFKGLTFVNITVWGGGVSTGLAIALSYEIDEIWVQEGKNLIYSY